jgi:hypothetical protein
LIEATMVRLERDGGAGGRPLAAALDLDQAPGQFAQ